MLKGLKRTLGAMIAGLASHHFSHAAPPTAPVAEVMSDAECALKEIQYDNVAVTVRPEMLAAYRGEWSPLTPELLAANRASKRWRNTTVGGAREEFDAFVEARMK